MSTNPFSPLRSEAEFVSFLKTIINDVVMPQVCDDIRHAVKQEVQKQFFPGVTEKFLRSLVSEEVKRRFARICELAKQCDDMITRCEQ